MAYRRELARIVSDTAVSQNEDWLGTDFQMSREGSICRVTVGVSTQVTIVLSPSSGGELLAMQGTSVVVNGIHTFEHALDIGRTWNLRTLDAAGTVVRHLVVQEIER